MSLKETLPCLLPAAAIALALGTEPAMASEPEPAIPSEPESGMDYEVFLEFYRVYLLENVTTRTSKKIELPSGWQVEPCQEDFVNALCFRTEDHLPVSVVIEDLPLISADTPKFSASITISDEGNKLDVHYQPHAWFVTELPQAITDCFQDFQNNPPSSFTLYSQSPHG